MTSFPQYNEDENFNKIVMDKNQTFILVEGSYDVPIYDAALRSLISSEEQCWDVVFGGGKRKIYDFLEARECDNFIAVLDKDFDENTDFDERAFFLTKYSIENYFFCEFLISHTVSIVLSLKYDDVRKVVSFEGIIDHYSAILSKCYFLLKKYQDISNHISKEDNIKWSDRYIFKKNSWKLEEEAIADLMDEVGAVLEKYNHSVGDVEKLNEILSLFPGKMLSEGVRRFVNEILESFGQKRAYKDQSSFKSYAASALYLSPSFIYDVKPAIDFIERRI